MLKGNSEQNPAPTGRQSMPPKAPSSPGLTQKALCMSTMSSKTRHTASLGSPVLAFNFKSTKRSSDYEVLLQGQSISTRIKLDEISAYRA